MCFTIPSDTRILYINIQRMSTAFLFLMFRLAGTTETICLLSGRRANPHPHPQKLARTASNNSRTDGADPPSGTDGRQRGNSNATPTERNATHRRPASQPTTARRQERRTSETDETATKPQTANENNAENENNGNEAENEKNEQHRNNPQIVYLPFGAP